MLWVLCAGCAYFISTLQISSFLINPRASEIPRRGTFQRRSGCILIHVCSLRLPARPILTLACAIQVDATRMILLFFAVCILFIGLHHYRWALGAGYRIWETGEATSSPVPESAGNFHSVILKVRGDYELERIISGREDFVDGAHACKSRAGLNPANHSFRGQNFPKLSLPSTIARTYFDSLNGSNILNNVAGARP